VADIAKVFSGMTPQPRGPAAQRPDGHELVIRRELAHLSDREVSDLAWAVQRLVDVFRPEQIYVFGSQALGTPGPNSDIDILVVVDHIEEPMYRLDRQRYGVLEPFRLPIELLFITQSDFERRLPAVASLPATVAREGRLLYAA
jgi:predicted nucleotidyltransferase